MWQKIELKTNMSTGKWKGHLIRLQFFVDFKYYTNKVIKMYTDKTLWAVSSLWFLLSFGIHHVKFVSNRLQHNLFKHHIENLASFLKLPRGRNRSRFQFSAKNNEDKHFTKISKGNLTALLIYPIPNGSFSFRHDAWEGLIPRHEMRCVEGPFVECAHPLTSYQKLSKLYEITATNEFFYCFSILVIQRNQISNI